MKKQKETKRKYIEIDPEALALLKDGARAALWVLGTAGFVGGLTMAIVLPGLGAVLSRALNNNERKIYFRERFDPLGRDKKAYKKSEQTLYYLRRQGYITYTSKSEDAVINLTNKGKTYLKKLKLLAEAPHKPKVWDKTWWVVLADIPTKTHRAAADHLRARLKTMEFYPLQRTVWIHPYDPTRAINELTQYYDLGKFVTVLKAQKLDYEDVANLKKHFSL